MEAELSPIQPEGATLEKKAVRDIVAHFKDLPVTQDVLTAYCNLKGYPVMILSRFEDAKFQIDHDARVTALLPRLFEELGKFRNTPEYCTKEEEAEIKKVNDAIEWNIACVLEDAGVVYNELDIITGRFANLFHTIMKGVGQRMSGMVATVFAHMAKEKFGDALVVKDIAEYYRNESVKLGVKLTEEEKKRKTK